MSPSRVSVLWRWSIAAIGCVVAVVFGCAFAVGCPLVVTPVVDCAVALAIAGQWAVAFVVRWAVALAVPCAVAVGCADTVVVR